MMRSYEPSQNLSKELEEKVKKELQLGFLNLRENFFDQAEINFRLALEFDKTCPDAFWGLMLVKLQLENEDRLYSNPMQFKDALKMEECQKALKFANQNLRNKYDDLLERIFKINEGDNY